MSNGIKVLRQSSGGYDENLKPIVTCTYKVIQEISCEVHFPLRKNDSIDMKNSGEAIVRQEVIRFWLFDTDNLIYINDYVGKYIDWCGYFWKIVASTAIEAQPCCFNIRWVVERVEPRDDKLIMGDLYGEQIQGY